MADELIKAGVPADRVAEAMQADGHDVTAEALDSRTEDQREFDAFLGPAPTAADYRIDYMGRIPAGVDAGQIAHFDSLARAWLANLGLPPAVGAAVIERALDVGHSYQAMSEAQRALWRAEQVAHFERLAGSPEKAAARLELAKAAIARGRDFPDALHARAGVLHDAGIMMHLALNEERIGASV